MEKRVRTLEQMAKREKFALQGLLSEELHRMPLKYRKMTMKEFMSSEIIVPTTTKKMNSSALDYANTTPFTTPRIARRALMQEGSQTLDKKKEQDYMNIITQISEGQINIGTTDSQANRNKMREKIKNIQEQLNSYLTSLKSP